MPRGHPDETCGRGLAACLVAGLLALTGCASTAERAPATLASTTIDAAAPSPSPPPTPPPPSTPPPPPPSTRPTVPAVYDVHVQVWWQGRIREPATSTPRASVVGDHPEADCTPATTDPFAAGDPLELLNEAGTVIAAAEAIPTTQSWGDICSVDFYFDVPPGEPFLESADVDTSVGRDAFVEFSEIGGVRRGTVVRMFTVGDLSARGDQEPVYSIAAAEL